MAPSVLLQDTFVIDLTQSDDEKDQPQGIARKQVPTTQSLSTLPLPISKHSSSPDDSLPKTSTQATRIIPEKYKSTITQSPFKRTSASPRAPLRTFSSAHNTPPQYANEAASHRLLAQDQSPRNGKYRDKGSDLSLGNVAKKRKLQNGASKSLVSAPTSPANGVQIEDKRDIIMRDSALDNTPNNSNKEHSARHSKEVRHALERQVFPYIRAGVSKYQGKLSSAATNAIGQKIAGDLVKTPTFLQNLHGNNFELSAKFEKRLALRANSLVDQYAKLILEGSSIDDLKLLGVTDQDYALSEGTVSNGSRQGLDSSTKYNGNAEVLGEGPMETYPLPPRHPKSRSSPSSSSPPAPYNDGTTALRNAGTTNAPNGSTAPITTRRSTRNLRSQMPSTSQPIVEIKIGAPATPKVSPSKQAIQSRKAADTPPELVHQGGECRLDTINPKRAQSSHIRSSRSRLTTLFRGREVTGLGSVEVRHGQASFRSEIANDLEDTLVQKSRWTNCSGDIATISWAGEDVFVCGALAHSDDYNMQYNKPGNLTFGSLSLDTLQAVAEHRVVRPLVDPGRNKENASDAMRQTQDPWIYTSVVSSSYSETTGLTFTASFDKTVKVWMVSKNGPPMTLVGNWAHGDKVNFVVTSQVHDRVATAADVYNDAIRVYDLDKEDVANSPYHTYSGIRAMEQARKVRAQDTWAYFPATIQWGKSPSVSHLLLVGYSPRSFKDDDGDIPDDKRNTGELCIWNVEDQSRAVINAARTQNVFEVVWHPSQPCFLAATSPSGTFDPEKTRTQVRLFAQNEYGVFFNISALDCPALDINELTIMANSRFHCYATASCTDGNTYVWDTAQGDEPIHILNHGESVDNPLPDLPREIGDAGVKFAAWGQTCERFYTGSSDGRVIAWDIRAPPSKAFVRNVLEASGGISAGVFSNDYSRLLIGDSTGKVHLLTFDDSDTEAEMSLVGAPAVGLGAGRNTVPAASTPPPKLVIPHSEPPAPPSSGERLNNISTEEESGPELAHKFLTNSQLKLHPDPLVGAVQGPKYHETSLFRAEAHLEEDPLKPLKDGFRASQKFEMSLKKEGLNLPQLQHVVCSDLDAHLSNLKLEEDFKADGIELDWDYLFTEETD